MSIITPSNNSNTLEVNISDYSNAYNKLQNQIYKRNQDLIFAISHTALLISQSLFLNLYEVNSIIGSYLTLWNKHPDRKFVSKALLEYHFRPKNKGFVNKFFQNSVSCNDFVVFVCFFLFYSKIDIISVLLTMCGVNSNLIITKEQVNLFFYKYSLKEDDYIDLFSLLDNSIDKNIDYSSEVYDLKVFIKYLKNSIGFSDVIKSLRKDIMKITMELINVEEILYRKIFYNNIIKENIKNETNNKIYYPKESCINHLYRIIFTCKPNPYHYDFSIQSSVEKVENDVIFQIKQRFGYSKRGSSTCFYSFTTRSIPVELHSEREQSDKTNKSTHSSIISDIFPYKLSHGIKNNKIFPL